MEDDGFSTRCTDVDGSKFHTQRAFWNMLNATLDLGFGVDNIHDSGGRRTRVGEDLHHPTDGLHAEDHRIHEQQ